MLLLGLAAGVVDSYNYSYDDSEEEDFVDDDDERLGLLVATGGVAVAVHLQLRLLMLEK